MNPAECPKCKNLTLIQGKCKMEGCSGNPASKVDQPNTEPQRSARR